MIDKDALQKFIESRLDGTEYFLVDIKVSPANEIVVEIDSMKSVDIDFCIELTRAIEDAFPREPEDYELEVGSSGLTSPFKVHRQFEKNIGNRVEIITRDGRKLRGILAEVMSDKFIVVVSVKEKPEGAKRPVEVSRELTFDYKDVKSVCYDLQF